MNCERARCVIDDHIDGRVAPADGAAMREHCASCPECAPVLAEAEAFVDAMTASCRASCSAAPADLPRRIMAALPSGAPPRALVRGLRRFRWPAAAAAAAAATVLVAALLTRSAATPKTSTSPAGAIAPQAERPPVCEQTKAPADARTGAGSVEAGRVSAGEAEILSRGGPAPIAAKEGHALLAGDTVRVTGRSPVEITLAGGSRVVLDAGAQAVVAPEAGGPRSIHLSRGRLFADVVEGLPPFVVMTPRGDVTALGTRFGVSLEGAPGADAALAVVVERGAVRVDRTGDSEIVRAGSSCLLRHGRPASWEGREACRSRLRWMARCRQHCRARRRGRCAPASDSERGGHWDAGTGHEGRDRRQDGRRRRRRGP